MAAGAIDENVPWCTNPETFIERDYGEAVYVYCRRSGDTHVLNFFSYEILKLLSEKEYSIAELCILLPRRLNIPLNDCPPQLVSSTISNLDDTGLIFPVSSLADSCPTVQDVSRADK